MTTPSTSDLVQVRQWGYLTFAAYAFDEDPLGRLVDTAQTRAEAQRRGEAIVLHRTRRKAAA